MRLPCPYLNIPDSQIQDGLVTVQDGNKHSVFISEPGIFRLSKTDCSWYSAQIANNRGDYAIYDGKNRMLHSSYQLSGSFVFTGYAEGGLIIENKGASQITINWVVA